MGSARVDLGGKRRVDGTAPKETLPDHHPTPHPLSLRNRELSSVELRTLDFEDATGSSEGGANLERAVEDLYVAAEESRLAAGPAGASLRDEVLDISALLHDAGAAIVDDSFLR